MWCRRKTLVLYLVEFATEKQRNTYKRELAAPVFKDREFDRPNVDIVGRPASDRSAIGPFYPVTVIGGAYSDAFYLARQ
jgi:hypothetical protein